ncbi:MAG: copper-translocating P-type ATPase [Simkaniaceae bacterium]|nr:copper-translocating P-type ATPase [Simkaniaceae bacterium]
MLVKTIIGALIALPLLLPMLGVPFEIPPYIQLIMASVVQFGIGYHFYIGAWQSLKKGSAGMDLLVAMGTSAAYGFSVWATITGYPHLYFETSAVLIVLIDLGRALEMKSKQAARMGMKSLLQMQAKQARVERQGAWVTIEIDDVVQGDRVGVRAGEGFPIDGDVVDGESFVNESMLTGESAEVRKCIGDKVFAGTINGNGFLTVIATGVGRETALGRIISLVEEASATKAPIQKLVDRVSAVFVPSVIAAAIVTFILWWIFGSGIREAIINSVAVLVIACPCALGLATPMVIVVATARGAKEGILIKHAEGLQAGAKIDSLLIDKTGTITEGKLKVEEVVGNALLAVSLAELSDHPISKALIEISDKRKKVESFEALPGMGVKGMIDGVETYLGSVAFLNSQGIKIDAPEDHRVAIAFGNQNESGYILLSDKVKVGTKDALEAIHKMGIEYAIVSGDRKSVVESVANEIAADQFFAETLPEEKAGVVNQVKAKGKVVGMVGDGINDAPAIAVADVGFAIGTGTDVAMESAAIGLMRGDMHNLHQALVLSRATMKKIRQNLFFAFFFNGIGIPVAAVGLLNPMVAGLAMALSSISVVLNAVTLQKKQM